MEPSNKAVRLEDRTDPGLPAQGTPIKQFEVRGFETAKLMPDGSWRSIIRYNGSDLARQQCRADVTWYNSRGHGTYQARCLISAELPGDEEINKPLVLDEDPQTAGAEIPQEVVDAMIDDVELEAAERT